MTKKSSFLVFILSTVAHAQAPTGTWEAWLEKLYAQSQQQKSLARPVADVRPDGQPLGAPLPIWVDCHLGWAFDRGKLRPPRGVVLRGSSQTCRGQLEEWAR